MSAGFIISCTQDGVWTAFDPRTGAFATGATREKAEATLRRHVEMEQAA